MLCPLSSRVFPITVPPSACLEGTHGDRVAGDNTQHSHRLLSFSCYITALCAPASQQHGAVACTFSSSSAFAFSPPCGSCSVFEVAHSAYKYALNECSFIHNCGNAAVHQITRLKNCTKSMHNKEEPLCESAQCT